jgi:uncharacterized protein YbaP (TraB family)
MLKIMINSVKFLCLGLVISSLLLTKIYAQKASNSLLWEISGNGLTQPSYLYGTIHAICSQDFMLSDVAKQKFEQSQQVYLELDMDDPSMMVEMQKRMFMQDGATLTSILSASNYTKVAKFFKDSMQINIDKIPKMKPFVLSSMTIPKLLGCPIQSYESTFTSMAQKQKKELLGLETVQEQFDALDKLSYAEQADLMLVKMVDDWQNNKSEFQRMLQDYKKQDVEALHNDILSSSSMNKEFEQNLLITRNLNWIPRITKVVREKPTFIAVGAGHLGGTQGLIALLKKQGFSVKALR